MDTLVATLDAITRLAPDADREQADTLMAQINIVDAAAKVAISLGTISDALLVETGEARRRAHDAVDTRMSAILRRQLSLIQEVPAERSMRDSLRPMSAPALLRAVIEGGAQEVTYIARELGDFVDALQDGVHVGHVDAYGVKIEGDELAIQNVGRWPLARIEAASCLDGLAVLLDDGTLIELQQAN